jgi:hypothetical protein
VDFEVGIPDHFLDFRDLDGEAGVGAVIGRDEAQEIGCVATASTNSKSASFFANADVADRDRIEVGLGSSTDELTSLVTSEFGPMSAIASSGLMSRS